MPEDKPGAKTMIDVNHVSMVFNIASEQLNSLKEYAIALSRRELRFKEFYALDDVSFQVKQGDVFGILGTNGSGKSTILKIIAGVLEPTKGSCTVEGSIAPLIELGAGFDLELTARENIFLNGALLGYSKKFIQQHFDEIVEFAEVKDFLDMPMKNYSSGMVARIALAIATVIIPDVLIVDEVLSVGDFMFQRKCEQRIQSLIKDHGVTVLIVSHNNAQIERLCNKAVWIEKGHLRAIGAAKEVCELYRAIGGRPGSLASEKRIIELLRSDKPVEPALTQSVFGDDRFSTAVQANQYCPETSKTAIMINSDSEPQSRISTALAGALNASLLTMQSDRLADVTAQEIRHRKPHAIFAIGNKASLQLSALRNLSSECNATLIHIDDEHAPLSLAAFRAAQAQNADWGHTAVIASPKERNAMLLLSPFCFDNHAPVFYIDDLADILSLDAHAFDSFSHFVILADETDFPSHDCPAGFNPKGATRFSEAQSGSLEKLNADINAWLIEQRRMAETSDFDAILVTSPTSDIDNHIAGPLAGRLNAFILLEDPQNLDSIARAIQTAENCTLPIHSIFYLGNELRFSSLNKELLAKAIRRA